MAAVSARHGLKLSGTQSVVPRNESAVYGRALSVVGSRAQTSCTSRSKYEPFATWRWSHTGGPRLTRPRYRLSTGRLEINSSKEVEVKVKEKSSRDAVGTLHSHLLELAEFTHPNLITASAGLPSIDNGKQRLTRTSLLLSDISSVRT